MNKFGLISGFIWGCLGTLIGLDIFGMPVLAGLVASPFIGLMFVRVVPYFERYPRPVQFLISYLSLLAAAAVFGLVVGIADMIFGQPGRIPSAVVVQDISICVGGLLLSNFYLIGLVFWLA